MQFVRQVVDVFGDLAHGAGDEVDAVTDVGSAVEGQSGHLNVHDGQLLAQVVVEIARDPLPFGFLSHD